MPHQCTNCDEVYPNGTEAILTGCPECGWNRFKYMKEMPGDEAVPEEETESSEKQAIIDSIERAHESGGKEVPLLEDGSIESVRIVEEGSYEINVSSLMDKEEIIMSIGEEGKYVVHLPSAFKGED